MDRFHPEGAANVMRNISGERASTNSRGSIKLSRPSGGGGESAREAQDQGWRDKKGDENLSSCDASRVLNQLNAAQQTRIVWVESSRRASRDCRMRDEFSIAASSRTWFCAHRRTIRRRADFFFRAGTASACLMATRMIAQHMNGAKFIAHRKMIIKSCCGASD